jgi:hypothetical protein
MPNTIHCNTHGETQETFVCSHLTEGTSGLGFNRDEPLEDKPFPDAWCDDCDLIFETHGGWNEETEKLVKIRLLCSGCYEMARIRNTRTDVTLDDLSGLRWKCHSCEEWHTGPCLDFSYDAPYYWNEDEPEASESESFGNYELPRSFLDEDICVLNGEHFFVRGIIHLPIIGTAETFRWGVWGSLSKENFTRLLSLYEDPKRAELEPMFSWLSNQIDEYENTINLKMYAHIQEPKQRPTFELESSEHPMSQEYYHGITAERVKEIMVRRLKEMA